MKEAYEIFAGILLLSIPPILVIGILVATARELWPKVAALWGRLRLKNMADKLADAQPPAVTEIKQLWDHTAFKYAIHTMVEKSKERWMFADTAEERERAHQEFRAVQRLTFELERLYNTQNH